MQCGGKCSRGDSKKLPSIRDLKISHGEAKWSIYFLALVAIFTLPFSFQSDVSSARVKWIKLKIDWHHLLQERMEEGTQSLNKVLLLLLLLFCFSPSWKNLAWQLWRVISNPSCQKCNKDNTNIKVYILSCWGLEDDLSTPLSVLASAKI